MLVDAELATAPTNVGGPFRFLDCWVGLRSWSWVLLDKDVEVGT